MNQNRIAVIMMAFVMMFSVSMADLRDAAREVIEKSGDAIVTIEVVSEAKFSYGGRQQVQESKTEIYGTVINEEGLVITSLSNVDPSSFSERLNPGEEAGYSISVKSINYIFEDGSEVPATLILRDNDLDLAFLRPEKKPEAPMTFISLDSSATPAVLDEAFTVGRIGRIAKRTVLGMSGEIQGVIEKPRPFYIPDSELVSAGSGVPVFNEDGEILGIVLLRVFPGGTKVALENESPYMEVIIPAIDIHEASKQAPEPEWEES